MTNRLQLSTISLSDVPVWQVATGSVILLPHDSRSATTVDRWIVDEIDEVGNSVTLRGEAPNGPQEVTLNRNDEVTILRQIGAYFS